MPITPYDRLRYNQVRARGSHNSYQRDEDLMDQMIYWRLRHVELDLHNTLNLLESENGNWYVYHNIPSETRLKRFSDGLALLAGFHRAVPEHEVVTVALDIKDHFDGDDHTPQKLDDLINTALPGLVYKPADLVRGLSSPANLRAGKDNWPLLKDVRGKFIFILTTGGLSPGSQLRQYIDATGGATARTCFVAPEISTEAAITSTENANAVFLNMTVDNAVTLAPMVFSAGLVSRAYGANNQGKFNKAKAAKAHLIGTDEVNTDVKPWSRTHNVHGWPFEAIELTLDPDLVERGDVAQITVQSDDIGGTSDSFYFRYKTARPNDNQMFSLPVAGPSSHVPAKKGKAGLMIRASVAPNAANFAVLRVADDNQPRVQVRKTTGGDTSTFKLSIAGTAGSGITGEGWVFLQLLLTDGGRTAEGLASYDAVHWVSIHRETFDFPLPLQGFACSSYQVTGRAVRYLFIGTATDLTSEAGIGNTPVKLYNSGFNLPVTSGS